MESTPDMSSLSGNAEMGTMIAQATGQESFQNGFAENTEAKFPTTPKKGRKPSAKKGAASTGDEGKSTGKKRSSKAAGNDDGSPSKKARATPTKGGVPESAADFSDADRMIIDMKRDGKPWVDITAAYEGLMGKKVAPQFCRQRYPKLMAAAQEWKAGDAKKLTECKTRVEEAIEAEKKKAELGKWTKIAETMLEEGSDKYSGIAVEKKWAQLLKQGLIGEKGNYIGPDAQDGTDVKEEPAKEESIKEESAGDGEGEVAV